MRTTLDIDDDLLAAAKEMARREGATAGRVVSRLLRESLTGAGSVARSARSGRSPAVAGFRPFPAKPGVVTTDEQVNALRDSEGI
ncbi:MAG: CopG family transcriptional regulator [Burkholderiaceae bacterium]